MPEARSRFLSPSLSLTSLLRDSPLTFFRVRIVTQVKRRGKKKTMLFVPFPSPVRGKEKKGRGTKAKRGWPPLAGFRMNTPCGLSTPPLFLSLLLYQFFLCFSVSVFVSLFVWFLFFCVSPPLSVCQSLSLFFQRGETRARVHKKMGSRICYIHKLLGPVRAQNLDREVINNHTSFQRLQNITLARCWSAVSISIWMTCTLEVSFFFFFPVLLR